MHGQKQYDSYNNKNVFKKYIVEILIEHKKIIIEARFFESDKIKEIVNLKVLQSNPSTTSLLGPGEKWCYSEYDIIEGF